MARALLLLVLIGIPTRLFAQDSRLLISVVDYGDAPIPNARITVVLNHPEPAKRAVVARGETDALGTTAISVEPRVPYVVLVSHDYFALPEPRLEPHIVPAEGDVVLGFKLASIADLQRDRAVGPGPPAEPRGLVAGQVVAPDGAPLATRGASSFSSVSNPFTRVPVCASFTPYQACGPARGAPATLPVVWRPMASSWPRASWESVVCTSWGFRGAGGCLISRTTATTTRSGRSCSSPERILPAW